MEVIEAIKKDKAYLKCKLVVKNWEKDFKKQHFRTPSKFDIKEAPTKIKYAYKKYFQLKSAALDSTLNEIELDDDVFKSDSASNFENLPPEPDGVPSPDSEQLMQTFPSGQELEKLLLDAKNVNQKEAPKESRLTMKTIKPSTNITSPFSNLSKKLFESRKFSIRNPRKLMQPKHNQSNCEIKQTISSTEELNNSSASINDNITRTFNSEKLIEQIDKNSASFNNLLCGKLNNTPVRQINEDWLNRIVSNDIIQKEDNEFSLSLTKNLTDGSQSEHLKPKEISTESYGLSNIINMNFEKPCDYVENSESDTDDHVIERLKPALKKRKLSNDKVHIQKPDIKTKTVSKRKNVSKVNNETSLSIEEEQKIPDLVEYIPFGVEKNVKPLCSDISLLIKSKSNDKCTTNSNVKPVVPMDKLEKKVMNGTINDNYVKINIEKKVYVRGRKNMSYSKFKKQQWKDKKALHAGMEFPEGGKVLCFKCNQPGHMARYCAAHKGETLLSLNDYEEESEIPTLEDMKKIVSNTDSQVSNEELLVQSLYKPSVIPDAFLKLLEDKPTQLNEDVLEVKPIYEESDKVPDELIESLAMFGHQSFRPYQKEAIMRILCGKSTLLIMSTGGGKSLCYQLPAYIYSQHYKCITLVISPLVSLMEDQVISMPEFLKAGCLHSNQPPTQRQKILQLIKDGQLSVLLISPEALTSGDVSNSFAGMFKSLPPIAFACIDEVHCVSQWSHNFRPSYLMICRILREKLNVKCILGLTATASQSTIKSVINHINIPDSLQGVITNPTLPDNLVLSVSLEKDKDRALISFLTSPEVLTYNSIIVYCIRRDECERVAAVIRSSLQEPYKNNMQASNRKRKRMSLVAEAYHAGMSASQRKKIQKHFMDGVLRIIVATVAFGMGINKADIRCIIHYNTPSSFESYVQEVGRAGRDGKIAHCHVFMSKNSNDKNELLKHIHANTIDRPTIRKLIQKIFVACECNKTADSKCNGHEVGVPIDQTVEELDVASENIATLLCYLELHPRKYIKVLNNAYTQCKIMSYGGANKLLEAAKSSPPLAMAYILEGKKNPDINKSTLIEFPVIEVSAALGWDSGMAKYNLKNLEWFTQDGKSKRSAIKVEFNTLGFRIKALGNLDCSELDKMLDDLHDIVVYQEKSKLYQLEEIFKTFSKLGDYSLENKKIFSEDSDLIVKSNELKSVIRDYFLRDENFCQDCVLENRPLDEERVMSDVRALISMYKDCSFTGRSVARIFQGIPSPNYPAIVWGRCKFWRSHLHEDFYGLVKIATQEIIHMKFS